MSPRITLRTYLKDARWRIRRLNAARRWGRSEREALPVVVGNSMPKSGSHLIIQILEGLPEIGPFVNPGMPPLNRNEDNQIIPEERIASRIRHLHPGDITYCYLAAEEPFRSLLTEPRVAPIFIYRDPRDVIVSHVFYATEMNQKHAMRVYYTEALSTLEERINAAILGVSTPEVTLTGICGKYDRYLGWFDCPEVLPLRFEELILEREQAMYKILDHLADHGFQPAAGRPAAVESLMRHIHPQKSGTFRKGQPGNWREHFTDENIRVFKENTGDLLIRLGYEQTQDWEGK